MFHKENYSILLSHSNSSDFNMTLAKFNKLAGQILLMETSQVGAVGDLPEEHSSYGIWITAAIFLSLCGVGAALGIIFMKKPIINNTQE